MSDTTDYPRKRYGLLMGATTTLLWSVLPILIKVAVTNFTPTFVTGTRFIIAFVGLVTIFALRRKSPFDVVRKPPLLGILAALCLMINYFTYNVGISYGSPSHAQVMIQSGGMFLVLYGVIFFGEHLARKQWLGIALVVVGFALFGQAYISNLPPGAQFAQATGFVLFSGWMWATYAALQRHVSRQVNGQQLNVLVFGLAALVILPFMEWPLASSITMELCLVLLVLGLNTLFAYIALAEALQHAPVSQVSMLIAVNPLLTLLAMNILERLEFNIVAPEGISAAGYVGAALVVSGVVLVVTKGK